MGAAIAPSVENCGNPERLIEAHQAFVAAGFIPVGSPRHQGGDKPRHYVTFGVGAQGWRTRKSATTTIEWLRIGSAIPQFSRRSPIVTRSPRALVKQRP